jgi:hypothetical protein
MSNNKSGFLIVFLAVAGLSILGQSPVCAGFGLEEEPDWKDDDFEYMSNARINYIIEKSNIAREVASNLTSKNRESSLSRDGQREKALCSNDSYVAGKSQWTSQDYLNGGKYDGWVMSGMKSGWGRRTYPDGDIYDGCWKSDGRNGLGIYIHSDGDKYIGNWEDNRISGHGTYIYADGEIYDGAWNEGEQDGKGVEIGFGFLETRVYRNGVMRETSKMSLLHDIKRQPIENSKEKRAILKTIQYSDSGLAMKHNYFSIDKKGGQKSVTVSFRDINRLLNSAKIDNLDDLLENKAIAGIRHFHELKPFAQEFIKDILYRSGFLSYRGGTKVLVAPEKFKMMKIDTDESYLLLLANVKNIEELKRIRFQTIGTRRREKIANEESYNEIKSFMESIGTPEVGSVMKKNKYLTMVVGGLGIHHAAGAIVDVEKINRLDPTMREESFDNQKLFYVYDSGKHKLSGGDHGKYIPIGEYSYFFGNISSKVKFLNQNEQEPRSLSCMTHATMAVLTAAKEPDLVKRIKNGEVRLYDLATANSSTGIRDGQFNEFELKTMLNLQKVFDDLKVTEVDGLPRVNVVSSLVSAEDKKAVKSMCENQKRQQKQGQKWYWNFIGSPKILSCELAEFF